MKNRRCLNPACSVVWKSRFQKHYSQRILQNEVLETPSIPVRRVRKDVLFDERHALLPSPTSKRYFRWGHRSQSRGCQHFRDFPDQRDCLEHRRPLAREGSPSVSSIQSQRGAGPDCVPLPHPLRFCVGTAASSQPSTMAARTGAQADLRRRRTSVSEFVCIFGHDAHKCWPTVPFVI